MREIKDLKQWYLSVVIAVILWGFLKHSYWRETRGLILSCFLLSSFKWQQEMHII